MAVTKRNIRLKRTSSINFTIVWFGSTLPASDLERAAEFYRAMLNIKVDVVTMGPRAFDGCV
jgi:predicted enzyme related to lactoylglutathione lyase